jgi:hypothetical protein
MLVVNTTMLLYIPWKKRLVVLINPDHAGNKSDKCSPVFILWEAQISYFDIEIPITSNGLFQNLLSVSLYKS